MSKRIVICSYCNTQMNHHADKISYPDIEEEGAYNPVYDGVLEEYYTCPKCGNSLSIIIGEEF